MQPIRDRDSSTRIQYKNFILAELHQLKQWHKVTHPPQPGEGVTL